MRRLCQTVDYAATRDPTVCERDCVPNTHHARFVAALLGHLALSTFYARYGRRWTASWRSW